MRVVRTTPPAMINMAVVNLVMLGWMPILVLRMIRIRTNAVALFGPITVVSHAFSLYLRWLYYDYLCNLNQLVF